MKAVPPLVLVSTGTSAIRGKIPPGCAKTGTPTPYEVGWRS